MELWDVYNRDRIKCGKTMVRGNPFEKDAYHMVVRICIFNSNNEMLIQQRQTFKEGWPNMWDITVGGSAIAGESSQAAAMREVFEEIGVELDLSNVRPNLTMNFDYGFDDIYLISKDVDLKEITLQYEEVQDAKYASKDEILEMIDDNKFIPYYKSLIELFFDSKDKYGCHK